jgi:hypothetical protein
LVTVTRVDLPAETLLGAPLGTAVAVPLADADPVAVPLADADPVAPPPEAGGTSTFSGLVIEMVSVRVPAGMISAAGRGVIQVTSLSMRAAVLS